MNFQSLIDDKFRLFALLSLISFASGNNCCCLFSSFVRMLDEANLKNNSELEAYRSFVEFETIWHRQLIGGVSDTTPTHVDIFNSIILFY